MKRAILERNLVVILFILVLVVFTFAERASKRYIQNELSHSLTPVQKESRMAAAASRALPLHTTPSN